jgi:hypothetical protein
MHLTLVEARDTGEAAVRLCGERLSTQTFKLTHV